MPRSLCDRMSDSEILAHVIRTGPSVVGFTLYMWNSERSAWLSSEIRKALPSVFTLAGGPEVTPDNRWLVDSGAFHVLVHGEGEPFAAALSHPPSLARAAEDSRGMISTGRCSFTPDFWPDPYFTGHLDSARDMPVHLETVRGCGNLCAYCAYRRISPTPRAIPAAAVLKTLRAHREAGRTEIVFLDPAFNEREDIPELLRGMEALGLSCFGEVTAGRGNLDSPALFRAGFSSVEAGLQTMNPGVLKKLGRFDSPESVIRGAVSLKKAGVSPVMDLILGLPGDSPRSILEAGRRLVAEGVGENTQVFYLSALPGTGIRKILQKPGMSYMDLPPYWITALPGIDGEDLAEARERLEDILGFDLDMEPRPVFCEPYLHTTVFSPDDPGEPSFTGRHAVLRLNRGDSLTRCPELVEKWVTRRFRWDPYCVLDVVIETGETFPLENLRRISRIRPEEDYHGRAARVLGRPGRLRIGVVADADLNPEWLADCASEAVTVVPWRNPEHIPLELLKRNIGLIFEGFPDVSRLAASFGGFKELVFFREPDLERLWCLDILELG